MSAAVPPSVHLDPLASLHGDLRALLVIAGTGSGNALTRARRVARLIQRGVDPQRILLLTFSRRAGDRWTRS